ncbi:MAG: SIS domain-containing protein [Anaerolineae bacterium]|nr:SIS domain-containing protein [Anaerolineae bacterium]
MSAERAVPGAFMRAEILEQPRVLAQLIAQPPSAIAGVAPLARRARFAMLAARGSSDNASTFGKYLLESFAGIPTALAAPSLFTLYHRPPRLDAGLVIGVSQSGAAADVIAVLNEARAQGALTLAITNTAGSPITEAAEHVVLLGAGTERALAATKTVTAQCVAYALLTAAIAQDAQLQRALETVPESVHAVLAHTESLEAAARRWRAAQRVAVVGRGYPYAAAQEIALKLKETCYIGAEAYSAADFLHGPLAMIEPGYPVLVLLNHDAAGAMTADFIARVLACGGDVLCFATAQACALLDNVPIGSGQLEVIALDVPSAVLSAIAFIVAGQWFALALALLKGHNPDRSRSVTKITVTR